MMRRVLQLILYDDLFPIHWTINFEKSKEEQYFKSVDNATIWDTKIQYEVIDDNFINQFLIENYDKEILLQKMVKLTYIKEKINAMENIGDKQIQDIVEDIWHE